MFIVVYLLAVIGFLFIVGLLGAVLFMIYSDLFGKTKSPYRMLNPIDFKERTTLIAEHQDEYVTLPAFVGHEPESHVICCWQFTYLNRIKVLITGKLWSSQMTFGKPLQPVTFSIHKSDVLKTIRIKDE